jgi:uncharacterized protein
MKKAYISMAVLVLVSLSFQLFGVEIPYLTGRVNDNALILSEETQSLLSEMLKVHEEKTTNQVVVLTVPTLDGENIEDYAYRVFQEWQLGQKDKDNGILIVVVPNDRKMRIEVGYGLESIMTDLQAGRIIRDIMTPRFRDGDFNGGIIEGAQAVIATLEGEPVAGLNDTVESNENSAVSGFEGPDLPLTERILFGAFIFGIIGLFTVIGIFTPGFGWFLYFFLIPFWAMFPIVVLGTQGALICLITYLILYPAAKIYLRQTEWYKKAKADLKTKGSASIGGLTFTSGSSGGSWSSGGSSGGGFSGGGGHSGGGGSSGGW